LLARIWGKHPIYKARRKYEILPIMNELSKHEHELARLIVEIENNRIQMLLAFKKADDLAAAIKSNKEALKKSKSMQEAIENA
jgi:hypothetical protein